jgi:RNA polymerase sigma-70 factor (ECF subfamily)
VVDRLALEEALSQLSPAHREALELVFLQGFSLAEVAQILGVALGTVKSRLSYARRALHGALRRAASGTEGTVTNG